MFTLCIKINKKSLYKKNCLKISVKYEKFNMTPKKIGGIYQKEIYFFNKYLKKDILHEKIRVYLVGWCKTSTN